MTYHVEQQQQYKLDPPKMYRCYNEVEALMKVTSIVFIFIELQVTGKYTKSSKERKNLNQIKMHTIHVSLSLKGTWLVC